MEPPDDLSRARDTIVRLEAQLREQNMAALREKNMAARIEAEYREKYKALQAEFENGLFGHITALVRGLRRLRNKKLQRFWLRGRDR